MTIVCVQKDLISIFGQSFGLFRHHKSLMDVDVDVVWFWGWSAFQTTFFSSIFRGAHERVCVCITHKVEIHINIAHGAINDYYGRMNKCVFV